LGEATVIALGVPSGAKIACRRNPQKNREWLGHTGLWLAKTLISHSRVSVEPAAALEIAGLGVDLREQVAQLLGSDR
jgi:hypothetical protein